MEEEGTQAAVAPSRKRGRQSQSQAPSEAADTAAEVPESTKGKGRSTKTKPAERGREPLLLLTRRRLLRKVSQL